MSEPDPIAILRTLIRCPSVTPDASGALDAIQSLLDPAGFASERLVFAQPGTDPVDNLFARFGRGRPHLCLAGHADVVPPGDAAQWSAPPFGAEIRDGRMIGRGAEDMKGALAAAIAAALRFVAGDRFDGSISFLVTGDEEGPAVNGTVRVLDWMAANDQIPDDCIVCEPASRARLGDAVKIGRRGSLTGTLTVTGAQGHVAYPDLAANPIPALMRLIEAISVPLDEGSGPFEPSHLEVTTFDVANPASNVIPARASATFNVRFNDRWSAASLEERLRQRLAGTGLGERFGWTLDTASNAAAFITRPGRLVALLAAAIEAETGVTPDLSTSGGTSDARFIARHCPVVEFGLVGRSMHQVDEHVPIGELEVLTRIYHVLLERYFGA